MVSLNPGKDPGLKQGAADIHQRIMSFTDGKFKPRGGSMIKTGGGGYTKGSCRYVITDGKSKSRERSRIKTVGGAADIH